MKKSEFIAVTLEAFDREIIKKLVLSRPCAGEITRVSAREVSHRGRGLLALEYSLPDNTVSHKNVARGEIEGVLSELLDTYRQANLITTLGEVEWKISSSGKEALLGADKLKRKIAGDAPEFERAIGSLDNVKRRMLTGGEDFLIKLGISDKSGRVHDKKQGKFRQINRFLEHIADIYPELPKDGELLVYDLCCGKSYLSFAVYYYLTEVKGRRVRMLGIDLKRDVIEWCDSLARSLGWGGMRFICGDIADNTPRDTAPDMVISLHACDIATDIVINRAAELRARVILSTPCCHRYLNDRLSAPALEFVTRYPQLRGKLCEALTDAIRLARLASAGYEVAALELTDPDDTPKNTLLRAVRRDFGEERLAHSRAEYEGILDFLLGKNKDGYLSGI